MQEMWYWKFLTFILNHGSEPAPAKPAGAKAPANCLLPWQDRGESHKDKSEKNLQFEIKTL